jgi:hypothetical protein
MEFTQRGAQAQPPQHTNHVGNVAVNSGEPAKKSKGRDKLGFGKWLRIASVVLLFSVTILVIAIASLLYFGNGDESKYVDTSKFQAVDLDIGGSSSGDQIYFGHITSLNDKYLVLEDIYYIVPSATSSSSSSSSSTNNYTLVKLGCELHAPYDQMIINRDHVIFWENLKSTGTVATKIAQYVQQNPNGPNCATDSASSTPAASSSSAATSTQNSTTAKP